MALTPSGCLHRLREFDLTVVAGNHDFAASGVIDARDFNGAAYAAIQWTAGQLSGEEIDFLAGLPTVSPRPPFTLVHGSLRAPVVEYLLNSSQALATLELLTTDYCLVGHSHVPFICRENGGAPVFASMPEAEPVSLDGERCIVNPGSVGQPRDRDARASYAIIDDTESGYRASPGPLRYRGHPEKNAAGQAPSIPNRPSGPWGVALRDLLCHSRDLWNLPRKGTWPLPSGLLRHGCRHGHGWRNCAGLPLVPRADA